MVSVRGYAIFVFKRDYLIPGVIEYLNKPFQILIHLKPPIKKRSIHPPACPPRGGYNALSPGAAGPSFSMSRPFS
jgi:hypothetical protein